jgi:hypothetical protein
MSLGGNINRLSNQSNSVFDGIIVKNFNIHLELTLSQNQFLYQKYPYYYKMLTGQQFDDPVEAGSGVSTPEFTKSAKKARQS